MSDIDKALGMMFRRYFIHKIFHIRLLVLPTTSLFDGARRHFHACRGYGDVAARAMFFSGVCVGREKSRRRKTVCPQHGRGRW